MIIKNKLLLTKLTLVTLATITFISAKKYTPNTTISDAKTTDDQPDETSDSKEIEQPESSITEILQITEPSSTVTLHPGDEALISFQHSLTTGYSFVLATNNDYASLQYETYTSTNKNPRVKGAPSIFTYRITIAKSAKSCTIPVMLCKFQSWTVKGKLSPEVDSNINTQVYCWINIDNQSDEISDSQEIEPTKSASPTDMQHITEPTSMITLQPEDEALISFKHDRNTPYNYVLITDNDHAALHYKTCTAKKKKPGTPVTETYRITAKRIDPNTIWTSKTIPVMIIRYNPEADGNKDIKTEVYCWITVE